MIYKKILFILIITFYITHLNGQIYQTGYIQNGDFNNYTQRPTDEDQVNKAIGGWDKMPNHAGTPDFMHEDAPSLNSGLKAIILISTSTCYANTTGTNVKGCNFLGAQEPVSGKGYLGFMGIIDNNSCGSDNFETEYIQNELQFPLIKGVKYHLSMKVSHAEEAQFSSSNIGMLVTKERPEGGSSNTACFLTGYNPQVLNTNIIDEENDWVTIQGEFIAEGGEKWLTIGSFMEASLETSEKRACNINGTLIRACGRSYYYVDDVRLNELDLCEQPCFANHEPILINGVPAETAPLPNAVIPNVNPFKINVKGATNFKIQVFHQWGNEVYQQEGFDACGFNNVELYWNGFSNNSCLSGVFTVTLDIWNCSHSISKNLDVQVFCNGQPNTYVPSSYTPTCDILKGGTGCCVDEWILVDEQIESDLSLHAENRITTEDVVINLNQDKAVSFKAGNYILLSPNTTITAESTASFVAKIESCFSQTHDPLGRVSDDVASNYIKPRVVVNPFNEKKIKITPNPFQDEITILFENISGDVIINISSFDGKSVYSEHTTISNMTRKQIDLSMLNNGIYYCTIISQNDLLTQKIIKIN